MNIKFTLLKTAFIFILAFFALKVSAQTATPFNGPSDATTAPPTQASDVAQVLCSGGTISLKTASQPGYTYQWYKKGTNGTFTLVQTSSSPTYTETAQGDGYYTYEVVTINGTNCSSVNSDPFSIYVLPTLTPSIIATNAAICESDTNSPVLTASATASNGKTYSYNYQWTKAGTPISGSTTNSYTVTDRTVGTVTYGVNVSFALSSSCSATATKDITINAVPTKPTITIGS